MTPDKINLEPIYLKYKLDLTNTPTIGNFDINKLKNKTVKTTYYLS